MEIQLLHDINNSGLPPPISFKPNPIISKKPDEKHYSLKVEINNHPVNNNGRTVSLYTEICKTGP